jgi:molybdopterin synthase sulfur carrier subunit
LNIVYFAWVREKIGKESETLTPPQEVETIADLLDWLQARSPNHAAALSDRANIRTAIDQNFASPQTPLAGAKEIAIFPPVTGG